MIEHGPARECDMVIAFLQAELSSPEYSKFIQPNLERNGLSRDFIDSPDLENEFHNDFRRKLLGYRGFGLNKALFTGFPSDVRWHFVEIEPQDHQLLFYAKDDSWIRISERTRSVQHAAGRIDRFEQPGTADRVRAIQRDLADGKSMARLILVESQNGTLILVEGHKRATAYVSLKWPRFSALLGFSATMRNWSYY
jgi:hypothetical protein